MAAPLSAIVEMNHIIHLWLTFPVRGVALGYHQAQNDLLSKGLFFFFLVDCSTSLKMFAYRRNSV